MSSSGKNGDAAPSKLATLRLEIPFKTEEEANIAFNSLRVDREPKRSQVSKQLEVQGDSLILFLEGPDARSLRLSSTTFFEHLALVQKTIERFSLPKKENPQQPQALPSIAKKPCLTTSS